MHAGRTTGWTRRDTPRSRSRFWLATPTAADHHSPGAWLPGGSATPWKIILLGYIAVCKRMTRASHEGGRATSVLAIRRERTGDTECGDDAVTLWWAESLRNIKPNCYAPSHSPNQFYLARVIASDLLDQSNEWRSPPPDFSVRGTGSTIVVFFPVSCKML